jgi:hypothetical protein
VGCVYLATCGNTNRTVPCDGRVTKRTEKGSFRRDLVSLKALWTAYDSQRSFTETAEDAARYDVYYSELVRLAVKYGKTRKQIAQAMNI